jgi:hypothetical protein
LLGLPHREFLFNHLACERVRIRGGDQGSRVSRAQLSTAQHIQYRLGKRQQPQQICDVAPTLAQYLGQALLRVTKALHQLPVSGGLFSGIEIGTLNILDDCELKNFRII